MQKLMIICLSLTSLAAYTGSTCGMQQLSAYADRVVKQSTTFLHAMPGLWQQASEYSKVQAHHAYTKLLGLRRAASAYATNAASKAVEQGRTFLHAMPGLWQQASEYGRVQARYACAKLVELWRAAPAYTRDLAHKTVRIPGALFNESKNLIQHHPTAAKRIAVALAGITGTYLIARSHYTHQAFYSTKLALANLLLRSGNSHCITWALQLGAGINHVFSNGQTALHRAAAAGNAACVTTLLDHGAVYQHTDRQGYQPIHLAALNGHRNVTKILIDHGENIDAAANAQQHSPLHVAAAAGQLKMVQYLVQRGAQINQRTAEGQTARDLAGAAGHTAVVKYLTQIMPRPQTQARGQTQSPIEDGATNALYEAIDGNDPMKAQVAIEAGAYLSHEDEARTPLRWAIARGTEQANEIAAALVQAGVPLHGIDRQGYTPLSVAIQLHNKRLARLLLRKGARLAPEESEAYQALVAEHEHSA